MEERQIRKISKFLSLVLRHRPEKIGIKLDKSGWTLIDPLLTAMAKNNKKISRLELEEVVETNNKKRFEISENGRSIRARQGHSLDVDLGYQPTEPPEFLFHGTPTKFLESIKKQGLNKQQRHHVHLHEDRGVANEVGVRRGSPIVLKILAKEMFDQGMIFFVTENKVWLTEHVPPKFIKVEQYFS